MKWLIIPLILFILICGCSSDQPVDVEPTPTIITPTPATVVPTFLSNVPVETVGPTPTPTNDMGECFNRSVTEYPDYCYDYFYWVRPIYSPPGAGYTARFWRNDGCTNLNKTSGVCEDWGDGLYNEIFMHNLTIVRNISGLSLSEVVAATTYYNKTYDLNVINGDLSFSEFIDKYWDGTYPSKPYNKTSFEPDVSVTVVPIDTFNTDGF